MHDSAVFFGHLLSHGSENYSDFTLFSDSPVDDAIDFKNVVTGVCPMFVMDENSVEVILEARKPQRKSRKALRDMFEAHSDRISGATGVELEFDMAGEDSNFTRLSLRHNIPDNRTDRSFMEFIGEISSSMNELLVTVKSMDK